MSHINFRVTGLPIPASYGIAANYSSKQGGGQMDFPKKTIPQKVKRWRENVAIRARKALPPNHKPWDGPVALSVVFYFPRLAGYPKDIEKARLNPKWLYKWKKPDLSNLLKSLEDAMTKIVYTDDSRIVDITTRKYFTNETEIEGALVYVRQLETGYQPKLYFCNVCGTLTRGTVSKSDELWLLCEKCFPVIMEEMKGI